MVKTMPLYIEKALHFVASYLSGWAGGLLLCCKTMSRNEKAMSCAIKTMSMY